MAQDLQAVRRAYAARAMSVARALGFESPLVEGAFAAVPREAFLTPRPWCIFSPGESKDAVTSDPAALYDDVLVVLDAPRGINNGQPSLHAAWLAAIAPTAGEHVVQIGIGTGYYTAILARLVGEGGRVEAFEIEVRLAEIARGNLAGLPQVAVHAGTGVGVALPPADIVYVSASVPAPDPGWLSALKPGGRLVFPWQPHRIGGTGMLVTRVERGFRVRALMHVSFVRCTGVGSREMGVRSGRAQRPMTETRSLWLTDERAPDETATAVCDRVWFSALEV